MICACFCLCLSFEYCCFRAPMSTLRRSRSTFCWEGPTSWSCLKKQERDSCTDLRRYSFRQYFIDRASYFWWEFCPWCTPLWKSFCLMHPFLEKFLLDAPLFGKVFAWCTPFEEKVFPWCTPKKPGWSSRKHSPQVHDPELEEQHFPCPDLPALPRVKKNKFE